jgi:hypothetical protein
MSRRRNRDWYWLAAIWATVSLLGIFGWLLAMGRL